MSGANLDYLKNKNLCSLKDTVKKTKRQRTHWGKIFSKHVTEKELVSRIHKEPQLNKINNSKQYGQYVHRDFTKL